MNRQRTALVAVIGALATLVLLWGASAGDPLLRVPTERIPDFAITLPEPDPVDAPSDPPIEPSPPEQTEEFDAVDSGPFVEPALLRVVFYSLLGAAGAALVGLLVVMALRRRSSATTQDESDLPEVLEVLLDATSTQRQESIRSHGSARNAVVACWVALEEAAEHSGLSRAAAETSAEFTRRVLDRWDVPPQVINDLAASYRAARFSRHEVTEQQREDAVAALAQINAVLAQTRTAVDPDGPHTITLGRQNR